MRPVLDSIDIKILTQLQKDARISNVKLADAVGLSPSPCLRRVRELEKQHVISRYVALLEAEAVGLPVSVVVHVTLEKQVEDAINIFEAAIREQPEVMECYLMTGEADYLLRVVTADVAAYQRFLMDHLTRVRGVANIKSSFALRQVKYLTALPIGRSELPLQQLSRVAKPQRRRAPATAGRQVSQHGSDAARKTPSATPDVRLGPVLSRRRSAITTDKHEGLQRGRRRALRHD
jgi:DNA-binding Lrp family transcriptional regulator